MPKPKAPRSPLSDYYAALKHEVGAAIQSQEHLSSHENKRLNLLVNHLKLPLGFWRQARVLEFGPGSGENALILARHGARMNFVEPLDYLADKLKHNFLKWGASDHIESLQIAVLEQFEPRPEFDAVFAEGFLEILEDPLAGINRLARCVGPEGFLVFNIAHPCGTFVEFLKIVYLRWMIEALGATDNWDQKLDCAKALFEEQFKKIKANRTFKSYAEDLLNPAYRPTRFPSFEQILDCLPKGFELYASWPNYINHDDLVWHKTPKDAARLRQDCLAGYYARYPHFLHSIPQAQRGLELFASSDGRALAQDVAACLAELQRALDERHTDPAGIIAALKVLKTRYDAFPMGKESSTILRDSISLFSAAQKSRRREGFVKAWFAADALRQTWGSPGHHYAFHRSRLYSASRH